MASKAGLIASLLKHRQALWFFCAGLVFGAVGFRVATIVYRAIPVAESTVPSSSSSAPTDWTGGVGERSKLVKLSRMDRFDVAMLGDSLTAVAPWNDLTGCRPLSNRGVPSARARDLFEDGRRIKSLSPKLVVIQVGINDLLAGAKPNDIVKDINQLVETVANPSSVLLISLFPVSRGIGAPDLRDNIRRVNEALQANHPARFLNLHSEYADGEGYLRPEFATDGIHLRSAAYAVWRERLEPFVRSACSLPAAALVKDAR